MTCSKLASWVFLGALIGSLPGVGHTEEELLKRIHPYGDFRFREELTSAPGVPDRWRPRVRLRFGAAVELGDDLHIGFRLVTGNPDDPRTAHQTLGRGGAKFVISLDRAYLEWRPQKVQELRLKAGKFPNSIRRPAVVQGLVTDNDVQPTGALGQYRYRKKKGGFDVALGTYVLDESPEGEESHATVAQAGLLIGSEQRLQLRLYSDIFMLFIGSETTVDRLGHPTGRGNLVENDRFVSDFHVVQGFVELETRVDGQPVVLSGGVMHNLKAHEYERDNGWFAGALVGSVGGWGSGRVFVQYQVIEQEAVFTPWAQDEFPDDRGSRFRAVMAGGEMGITNKVSLQTWILASTLLHPEPQESDSWIGRLRFDLNVRF